MTYTEIIDNIQTRIENIISERLAGTYQHITIEPSDYNPDIDDEITVTITVLDQNDDPITNWNVPLMINGTSITGTITTNSQGVATYTHTCDTFGMLKFSVKSSMTQIKIGGWKTLTEISGDNIYWKVEYNETHTKVRLSYGNSQTATTSETAYGTTLIDSNHSYLTPILPVMFPIYNGNVVVIMRNNGTALSRRSTTGSTITMNSQYWQVSWPHHGLP
jgi:hypothetical protein